MDDEDIIYKKSQKLSYQDFKQLFHYEENDRDKKDLKKDFKKIEKKHRGTVKFKHLIDYYLTSSELFAKSLDFIDTNKILDGLESGVQDGFNEKLLKLICINQAVSKVQKELGILMEIKEQLIGSFYENRESEKFAMYLDRIKNSNQVENDQ